VENGGPTSELMRSWERGRSEEVAKGERGCPLGHAAFISDENRRVMANDSEN
jgi:hypothetical protein